MSTPRVVVIDPGIRQLHHLAVGLSRQGMLASYVCGFQGFGGLAGAAASIPAVGRIAGRRRAANQIPSQLVHSAAVLEDGARALLTRTPGPLARHGRQAARRLMYGRNAALGRAGAQKSRDCDTIVASYGAGLEAFRATGPGVLRVVDYPIAHHRYSRRLLSEEAQLNPEFAPTLNYNEWPPEVERRFDRECDASDVILVGSRFVQDSFAEEGYDPSKVEVVPYGVDTRAFHTEDRQSHRQAEFAVLFLGQIGQRKGISYLLDAYAEFRRPGTRLVLLGNFVGDPAPVMARSELYTHLPHVPHDSVPDVIRRCSVMVLPSLIEGMSLAVLETMACGVPVIVSANCGLNDVIRDGEEGFVVPIRDPGAIYEKLDLLYRDITLRRAMGAKARLRAEEFSWDRYVSGVTDVIKRRCKGADRDG